MRMFKYSIILKNRYTGKVTNEEIDACNQSEARNIVITFFGHSHEILSCTTEI